MLVVNFWIDLLLQCSLFNSLNRLIERVLAGAIRFGLISYQHGWFAPPSVSLIIPLSCAPITALSSSHQRGSCIRGLSPSSALLPSDPCQEADSQSHSCPRPSPPLNPPAPRAPRRWSWSWWRSRMEFSSPPPPWSVPAVRLTRQGRRGRPGAKRLTSSCQWLASLWISPMSGGSPTCATKTEEVRQTGVFEC